MLGITEASPSQIPRPRRPVTRRVVIIGGGFTGAALARRLALSGAELEITVFEPRARLGAGLAYDTQDPALRLNVAAARMRALPDDPQAFARFLQETGRLACDPEAVAGEAIYARRADFGDFMQAQMAPLLAYGAVEHRREAVISVSREHGGYAVAGDRGSRLHADILVIATSHPAPRCPEPVASALSGTPRLMTDPFDTRQLARIAATDPVIVLGAGLTALDLVASLRARGHQGLITLLSRSNALPQPHATAHSASPSACEVLGQPLTARRLLTRVRAAVAAAEAQGLAWQSVFDSLRQQGQAIWSALPHAERQRFLRHLRRRFETHRYRMPPQIAAQLQEDKTAGRLQRLGGRIVDARGDAKGLSLTVSTRGGEERRLKAQWLLVATGPDHADVIARHGYLQDLAAQGLIRRDSHGLGLACDGASRAICAHGAPVDTLFVAGPLARGTFGELTGVPEIAAQVDAIAHTLLGNAIRQIEAQAFALS